jgi:hypothetical protein
MTNPRPYILPFGIPVLVNAARVTITQSQVIAISFHLVGPDEDENGDPKVNSLGAYVLDENTALGIANDLLAGIERLKKAREPRAPREPRPTVIAFTGGHSDDDEEPG